MARSAAVQQNLDKGQGNTRRLRQAIAKKEELEQQARTPKNVEDALCICCVERPKTFAMYPCGCLSLGKRRVGGGCRKIQDAQRPRSDQWLFLLIGGHRDFCGDCAEKIVNPGTRQSTYCPMCRKEVVGCLRVFC